MTYPVMTKLSKTNGLFLFYLVANESENHWRKLARFTLWRHKMAALELQIAQNADVSIYFKVLSNAIDEPFL